MEKNVIFATRDDFLSAIRNWGLTEKWEHAKFIFIYNSNEAMESAKFEFENNIIPFLFLVILFLQYLGVFYIL